MAVSQFIPDIRIGYLYTYWGPLGFVLAVTISREAIDDLRRHKRDREVNSQKYKRFVSADKPPELVSSSKLKVGDLIVVEKDERVPADLILLRTSDKSGAVFVRTDMLDGELYSPYYNNKNNRHFFEFQVKRIGNCAWLCRLRKN